VRWHDSTRRDGPGSAAVRRAGIGLLATGVAAALYVAGRLHTPNYAFGLFGQVGLDAIKLKSTCSGAPRRCGTTTAISCPADSRARCPCLVRSAVTGWPKWRAGQHSTPRFALHYPTRGRRARSVQPHRLLVGGDALSSPYCPRSSRCPGRRLAARRGIIGRVAGEEMREPVHAAGTAGWPHRHRDVSGGWLRPTVFGAVDGLVTNASLIAGLGGGGVSAHAVVLAGVAAAGHDHVTHQTRPRHPACSPADHIGAPQRTGRLRNGAGCSPGFHPRGVTTPQR
jgi:hypothetical protein